MKRDNELQKPSHILVFDQEKGKATYMKMYDALKAKGLFIKLKYQKSFWIDPYIVEHTHISYLNKYDRTNE